MIGQKVLEFRFFYLFINKKVIYFTQLVDLTG